MRSAFLKATFVAGFVSLVMIETAAAGGLKREGYNIDLLFDPSRFVGEATATFVFPGRKLDNVVDTKPSNGIGSNGIGGGARDGVKDTENYWIPRVGLKAGFADTVDCLLDYSQPWGVHTNPGHNWMGANENIETKVTSNNYAGTCSYKFQAGPGQLRLLGGVFYQELSGFKERLVAPVPTLTGTNLLGNGVGRLDLKGDGWGWRVGAAYEIPDIAFRASLVYNSQVNLDNISGTLDLTQVPALVDPRNPLLGHVVPVFGETVMPQSLKLSVQSGIAPDWLAFGSIEWMQWSKLQSLVFCPEAYRALGCKPGGDTVATSLDLIYRDGWTIQGGVGHKFNDQWSGATSLTWDRGTSQGWGHQTDTWTLGAGAVYAPNANVEFRLAGALGLMTSGSAGQVEWEGRPYGTEISYDFGNDLVSAINASFKVKW